MELVYKREIKTNFVRLNICFLGSSWFLQTIKYLEQSIDSIRFNQIKQIAYQIIYGNLMNIEIKSILMGIVFSFLHITTVLMALKCFKKIAPVFIHAISALMNLILLCVLSLIIPIDAWISFSVLSFFVSSFLFIFGVIYKSLMIRILCYLAQVKNFTTINQINEVITTPTFLERCLLLERMGNITIKEGYYLLTQKGIKIVNFIKKIRKLYNIGTSAMYNSGFEKIDRESKWWKFFQFRFHTKHLIIIVYVLLATLYIGGLYQKLYKSADNRMKFHAIPIAISNLYQGHKHDYRGWLSTERPFQGVNGVLQDSFIKKQRKASVNKEAGHYYWVADDRGYADYVIASFALFGPYMKSLYHFWFLILFLSVTLFIKSFSKHEWTIAYLAFLMLGMHSAMALLKLIHVSVAIFEPRYLDVLAIVPVFHMVFTALIFEKKDFYKHLPSLLGQTLIFVFLYHARSSLGWEIVAVTFASIFCILIRKASGRVVIPLSVAILLISSCTVLLSGYKHLTYHPSYFKEMGARTFWHNAIMGIRAKSLPMIGVCDHTTAGLVLEHAKKSGCNSKLAELSSQELLNSLGNWCTVDWVEYEYWAKNLYFSLLSKHKLEFAYMYFFYKPRQLLKDVFNPNVILFANEAPNQSFKRALPWNPLHLFYLIPFLLLIYGTRDSLYLNRWKLLKITLVVFFCAMIPAVAFYSDILTHGGLSVMAVLVQYLSIFICLSAGYFLIKNYYYKVKLHEIQ